MKRVAKNEITNAVLLLIEKRDKTKDLIVDSFELADQLGVNQDKVRKVFSELRRILIPFLAIKKKGHKGLYLYYEPDNPKHHPYLNRYIRMNINQVKTMYVNDIVKYLPIIKDEKLKNEIGQMIS